MNPAWTLAACIVGLAITGAALILLVPSIVAGEVDRLGLAVGLAIAGAGLAVLARRARDSVDG